MEVLGGIFSAFDLILDEVGVENVKTIGDSYMVIAGTTGQRNDHAQLIATAALRMNVVLEHISAELEYPLLLRCGIHTGSIIGGIIGQKKPIYDYWGRTVNCASRLEHDGIPGRIQISETTYWRLKNEFDCEPRGEIELRGIGRMNTYFVIGPKPARSGSDTVSRSE